MKDSLARYYDFARKNGKTKVASFVNGTLCRNATVYEDAIVKVAIDPLSKEMEIRRVENGNPVICIDEDGEVYRTHGEFRYVEAHLQGLLTAPPPTA